MEPLLADVIPEFAEDREEVVVLEVERTFWEKATILHAEFHRPTEQPIRDRFARHYADLASSGGMRPGTRHSEDWTCWERVATFKPRFFGSRWADYETARPGSLKLCPPAAREAGNLCA